MKQHELHKVARSYMDKIEKQTDALFNEADEAFRGMTTKQSNKVWDERFQARFDKLYNEYFNAYRVAWYNDPEVPYKNKVINHRHLVSQMREKGLRKMTLREY